MKKINLHITNLILISIFAALGCITTMAQKSSGPLLDIPTVSEEKRPFDFADKFYAANGVEPSLIFNRPTGTDGFSVNDKTSDEKYRDVRLIATMPAYNYDGSILYWNMYGELFPKSFTQDDTGLMAMKNAQRFPIFVFPSATQRGTNRQSSLIEAGEGYFEQNPLGLGVLVEVRYSAKISSDGEEILKGMEKRNGVSLDGTPIIKTIDEINLLTRMEVITQKMRGLDDPREAPYAIAKIIQNPEDGAITPDSFLIYITQPDGKPLEAESFFVDNFNYLQSGGVESLHF